jgi:hypothetical protein
MSRIAAAMMNRSTCGKSECFPLALVFSTASGPGCATRGVLIERGYTHIGSFDNPASGQTSAITGVGGCAIELTAHRASPLRIDSNSRRRFALDLG